MREHVAAEHPERWPSYIDVATGEVRRGKSRATPHGSRPEVAAAKGGDLDA
jgi:hypothetical protein